MAHAVAAKFGQLVRSVGVHRPGVGFYTLRHVFRTVADGARDPVACDRIMGHADPTMGGRYRERIDDARLVAVAEHVRQWLFGADGGTSGEQQAKEQPESIEAKAVEPAISDRPQLRIVG